MKTAKPLLIFMAIMSLMACKEKSEREITDTDLPITIYSSNVHVITLYVNTVQIENNDINEHATFRQPDTILNKDYTTHVRKGDIVVWKGESTSNPLDIVNITSINHQGGPKLFGKNLLQGNKGDNEVVVGVITEGPEMKDGTLLDTEKYDLHVTVKKNEEPRIYSDKIDPKIQVH